VRFIAEFKKSKEKSKVKGVVFLGGAGIVGQQTARSGIPRLLGVRLESHSTSKKAAQEIIKGGGFLDPNRGGGGITKDLVSNDLNSKNSIMKEYDFFEKNKQFLNRAKNNVFITGKHINYDPSNNNAGKLKKAYQNIVGENVYRKLQRAFYRGQSEMPMDKKAIENAVKEWRKSPETQKRLLLSKQDVELASNRLKELSKTGAKEIVIPARNTLNPEKRYTVKDLKKQIKDSQESIRSINSGIDEKRNITDKIIEQRKPEAISKGLTGSGRSLYIGGSDDYFNKNFVPDPDDVYAMKASNKIKVSGNRAKTTLEALKREGGGSKLKGITKLIKANPKRMLAGAAILGAGGLVTGKLSKVAYNNLTSDDGKVKGFMRKNKSGKWSNVKSFIRKLKGEK